MIKASIISSALLLVVSALSYSQTAADQQQEIQTHIRQAQAYLNDKKPDLAIAEYNAVLASDPNNLDASANLGVVYFFSGDYGKATHELRSALKLRPGIPKLQALLGMSEKRAGENKSAQADLEQSFDKLKDERLVFRPAWN